MMSLRVVCVFMLCLLLQGICFSDLSIALPQVELKTDIAGHEIVIGEVHEVIVMAKTDKQGYRFVWELQGPGKLRGELSSAVLYMPPEGLQSPEEEVVIRVIVTDNQQQSASASQRFTLRKPTPTPVPTDIPFPTPTPLPIATPVFLCSKYGSYTRESWRSTFLRKTELGTWHVFVFTLSPLQTVDDARKVIDQLQAKFPNHDFNIMPTMNPQDGSNSRYEIVLAEGLKNALIAKEIAHYASRCGIASDAYPYQQARTPLPIPTKAISITSQSENCWTEPSAGKVCREPITDMEFVWIPGDCFQMGSPDSERGRFSNEGPVHEVCLDGFWMGKYEVTQREWQTIMGNNPAKFGTKVSGEYAGRYPVETVSWDNVQQFIQILNGRSDEAFRLPSEAQWEYACRAGTQTPYSFGNDVSRLGEYAWYVINSGSFTHPVGTKKPNAFGLYDMHGNVYEWTEDAYSATIYTQRSSKEPVSNPIYSSGDSNRVLRGGGRLNFPSHVRCAIRDNDSQSFKYNNIGFRLVMANSTPTAVSTEIPSSTPTVLEESPASGADIPDKEAEQVYRVALGYFRVEEEANSWGNSYLQPKKIRYFVYPVEGMYSISVGIYSQRQDVDRKIRELYQQFPGLRLPVRTELTTITQEYIHAMASLKRAKARFEQTISRLKAERLELNSCWEQKTPETTCKEDITGMEFVWIPGGCFQMGSPNSEEGRDYDEGPVHEVCLNGFWMGKYEVTQEEWQMIVGNNPSRFNKEKLGKDTNRHPVEKVSWDDVQQFIKKLNSHSDAMFRLPSEAEWEYTCRAGTQTMYSFGENASLLGKYAWYGENSGGQTHPIGNRKPNAFGLYDMHGNVWELCEDSWHTRYRGVSADGSVWKRNEDENKSLLRGGSWVNSAGWLRCAYRIRARDLNWYGSIGFRMVRPVDG